MIVLATVDFGKAQVTQLWELIPGNPSPWLKVADLMEGKYLAIKLDKSNVVDLEAPDEKHYPGILKVSDAILVPSN